MYNLKIVHNVEVHLTFIPFTPASVSALRHAIRLMKSRRRLAKCHRECQGEVQGEEKNDYAAVWWPTRDTRVSRRARVCGTLGESRGVKFH